MMRQRLVLHPDGVSIETVEPPEVTAGRSVAFCPARTMPRSWANWERHRATLIAAPVLADTLENIRDILAGFITPGGMSKAQALAAIADIFDRAEVRDALASIETCPAPSSTR